jgi:NTE family protein
MDDNWAFRAARQVGGFLGGLRHFSGARTRSAAPEPPAPLPRIGLALGGGFARGIAHAGVLKILEQNDIPIYCITGVSAGAIVAAAYASGASPSEIARAGCAMRFGDVGRWQLARLGLVGSQRMHRFLERLLKVHQFEEMRIALGVLATDLATGESVPFYGSGPVFEPIRASCSYPGLFEPVRFQNHLLVDGAMSMEIPAALARQLGATHVVSVHLPVRGPGAPPSNMFQVVNRCFQIMQCRSEDGWRSESDMVIAPDVRGVEWDGFARGPQLIEAGEAAALAMLPTIKGWLDGGVRAAGPVELLPKSLPQEI